MTAALVLLLLAVLLFGASSVSAAERSYPETGFVVQGEFLDFYDAHGGPDVFGYPRTAEHSVGGRTVQYFQRARFEWWPENPSGFRVQLGLLAEELGKRAPASSIPPVPYRRHFPETGHSVGGVFREFWETRGALTLFGYPITEEISENGLTVQYFQRARLEWHPENPLAYKVQLGLLGDEILASRTGMPQGKLLLSSGIGGDFFLVSPAGALTKIGQGIDPAISRDGRWIAFGRTDGLYVMPVDGGAPSRIYDGPDVRGPVFSPDGREIAFFERYTCVRRLNFRENQFVSCHRIKVVPAAGGQDWLPAGQSPYATSPTWSPDGTRLVFKDETVLSIVSRSEPARPLSEFQPRYWTPEWSPFGGRIAVAFDQNRDHYDVALVPDDGRVETLLLTSTPFGRRPITNVSPTWSPDGAKIAFASDRDGVLKLWVMDADGSNPIKLNDQPLRFENVMERLVSWGGG